MTGRDRRLRCAEPADLRRANDRAARRRRPGLLTRAIAGLRRLTVGGS